MKTGKLFIVALAMSAVAALTFSCDDSEEKKVADPELSVVTDDLMQVAYTGSENLTIQFICTGDWTAELTVDGEDRDWIAFTSATSGSKNGTLSLSVEANELNEPRTASVKIESGTLKATVQVKQDAKILEITFRHPSVMFTREQLEEISTTYYAGTAPSLNRAVDFIFIRADGGLTYNPKTVTDDEKRVADDNMTLYKRMSGPAALTRNLVLAHALRVKGADETQEQHQAIIDSYARKAVEIMYDWADACKAVEYPVGTEGGTDEDPSTGAGMYLARVMWPFFVCYDMLQGTEYISPAQDEVIVAWFRNTERQIRASINAWHNNDYFNKQEWQNHLVAHMMGLLTIGYVLEDASLVQFAIDSPDNPRDFYELIAGVIFMEGDTPHHRERAGAPAVQTGEIYDRYRHDTAPLKGLQYASLSQTMLAMAARTCQNNGIDMFAYTAPSGENLRLPYEFYADFYVTGDAGIKGGYYTGEDDRIGKADDLPSLFELGYAQYPGSEAIKNVINSIADRGANTMHDQLGYLRLFSVSVDKTN
ncbi:MAG: alginate lyase family protein [Rikenellaceae bacterium]|nr:alginate lyase family protein [Rikenellaceae bacterium]